MRRDTTTLNGQMRAESASGPGAAGATDPDMNRVCAAGRPDRNNLLSSSLLLKNAAEPSLGFATVNKQLRRPGGADEDSSLSLLPLQHHAKLVCGFPIDRETLT